LHQANQLQHENFLERKHYAVSRILVRAHSQNLLNQEFLNSLESLNYVLIEDLSKIKNFLSDENLELLHSKSLDPDKNNHNISIYLLNEHHYILLNIDGNIFLLKDKTKIVFFNPIIVIIFLAILTLFLMIYLTTVRKLYPIKILKNHIKKLGNESFDIRYKVKGDDEIAELAREFATSSKRLHKLKESRNIFIRNIMHELKTPIMKGKLLTELPKTEKNNEKMQEVFYKLENLINEFASIEEIIASSKQVQMKPYSLEDVLDNAKDMLLYDEENNQIIYDGSCTKPILLNFKLFSIAVKNLIDNAIKHSKEKKVYIGCKAGSIVFVNDGAPLKRDLKEYFEPFSKESDSNGFGLGLYIVHKILKAHRFKLEYSHEQNKNYFTIVF
jgi:two-component system OmpR family sensor kinase